MGKERKMKKIKTIVVTLLLIIVIGTSIVFATTNGSSETDPKVNPYIELYTAPLVA